jgi:hypothetical protein
MPLPDDSPRIGTMVMQVGMILGYFTSYPANIFLLKSGWKGRMPRYKPEMKKKMREERKRQQQAT